MKLPNGTPWKLLFLGLFSEVVHGRHFGYSSEYQTGAVPVSLVDFFTAFWFPSVQPNYGQMKAQDDWTEYSKSCGGKRQSPIRINSEKAIPLAIPALEMIGFHNLIPQPVTIINNGHSVEIKPKRSFGLVFGALLAGEYEVEGFHFHWGKKNNRGSEHVINDMRFALEMHIVMRSTKYETISEAQNYTDGLAVLGFFFDVREEKSESLEPIIEEMTLVNPEGSAKAINRAIALASFLPKNTELFYTYRGSLTTPPCSEAVTWVIFPDPMPISYSQVQAFRRLTTHDDAQLVDNFRETQWLGNRKIYVRRFPSEDGVPKNIYHDLNSEEFWE